MTSQPDFRQDKWVRLMCDYSTEGVWDWEGCAWSVSELPINEALQQRIHTWQDRYEALESKEDSNVINYWDAFAAEGLAIAHEIKKTLPDWTVIYHDEAAAARYCGQGLSRDHFEYEITLAPDEARESPA